MKPKNQIRSVIRSIIGDDSDLICRNCKKKKKMRMSSYCTKCQKEHNQNII